MATPAGMTVDAFRSALRAQGAVLLRSVFDPGLMAALRTDLDRTRVEEEARFGMDALKAIGQDGYVSDLLRVGQSIEAVLDSDVLHDVLQAVFGDEARLYIGQGIILDPGKGRGVWPRCWHADMFQVRAALPDPTYCFGLNCLVLADDLHEENGPTSVLIGSQNLKELRTTYETDIAATEFRAIAPAGSLLLLDGGTWHSAGINRSNKPRRVVKLLFTRKWIRPLLDYSAVVPAEVDARLTARVRRLLRLPNRECVG